MKCQLIGLRPRLWFALSTRGERMPQCGSGEVEERGRKRRIWAKRNENENERKAINVNCSTHESLAWPPSGWQLCGMSLTIMWLAHTHARIHTHTHMTITAPKPREHFSGASNSLEPLQSANVLDMLQLHPLLANLCSYPLTYPPPCTGPPPQQQLLLLLLHAKRCFNMKLVRSFGFWLSCVPATSSSTF